MPHRSEAGAAMVAADKRVRKAIAAAATRARKEIAEEAAMLSSVRAATPNNARMATAAALSATIPAARTFTVTSLAMLTGTNGMLIGRAEYPPGAKCSSQSLNE